MAPAPSCPLRPPQQWEQASQAPHAAGSRAAAAAHGQGAARAGWPAAAGPRDRSAAPRAPSAPTPGPAEPAASLQLPACRARHAPPFPPPLQRRAGGSAVARSNRPMAAGGGAGCSQWRCALRAGRGRGRGATGQWGGGAAGMRWRREHRRPAAGRNGAPRGPAAPHPLPWGGEAPSPPYGSAARPGSAAPAAGTPYPAGAPRPRARPLRCFPCEPGSRRPRCCGGGAAGNPGRPPPGRGVATRRCRPAGQTGGGGDGSGWATEGTSMLVRHPSVPPSPRPRGLSGWGALPAASPCCIAGEIPPAPPPPPPSPASGRDPTVSRPPPGREAIPWGWMGVPALRVAKVGR